MEYEYDWFCPKGGKVTAVNVAKAFSEVERYDTCFLKQTAQTAMRPFEKHIDVIEKRS